MAAHRTQVVQQRQQHQRQIAPAGQHPVEVARQLYHGAHQRIEALRLTLALVDRGDEVLRHVLHFLGEQRRAVDLEQAQHALHLVQVLRATLEQRHVVGLLDIILERTARLGERRGDLASDELECLRCDFGHARWVREPQEPPSEAIWRTLAVLSPVSSIFFSRTLLPAGVLPGSRKPAADLRSPAESSASLAIAAEVALVDSAVCALISFSTPMLRAMFCAAVVWARALEEMLCTRLAIWFDTCSISSSAAPAFSASSAPPTTSVVLRSIDTTASLVSVWMVRTSTSICLVALAARSASRCTSSATTAKPRPASPAMEDWIEAFNARMLVCSAMSLMSSTMLPISCELSPRRLMRLEVSWMVSRMAFMPSMVRRTASPPLCATSTEWRATSEARSALPDTSSTEPAMLAADSVAEAICLDCAPLALARCCESAWVCLVADSSWIAEPLIVVTSPRSASTA